jgi:hypothetical protein
MSRRRDRPPIPVTLTLPAEAPSPQEIDAILMTMDAVTGLVGRSGLTLILAGSRSKRVLEKEWDQIPGYGAFRGMTAEVIGTKVDWCIHHKWLRIEYDRDIPLLYHTPKGWERVQKLLEAHILGWFEHLAASGDFTPLWSILEEIHRDIKFHLLTTIVKNKRQDLVPVLQAWFPHEVRKLRAAINDALEQLGHERLSDPRDRPKQADA